MEVTAIEIVQKFAKKARPEYVAAFEAGAAQLAAADITNRLRLSHFMAQVLHETGGLTIFEESGKYTAKRLGEFWDKGTWRKYFKSRNDMMAMGAQCAIDDGEALFNRVYGNRMGNGPASSGDGWKYRGRGLMQTTGREDYQALSTQYGVDFVGDPTLIFNKDHALKPSLWEWSKKHCNDYADQNDIEAITRKINGGLIGIDERKALFAKIWSFVKDGKSIESTLEYRVQAALNAAGFDCGKPDGVIGVRTRTAIIDYRKAKGLPKQVTTATITPDLIESLGL